MVLCVSDVIYDGNQLPETADEQTQVSLEVTDGWYRLRASADAPLQRAVKSRKLRVGMKIACFGAKVPPILLH